MVIFGNFGSKYITIMKKVMMPLMAVVFAITANAQYNTNYYNLYGSSTGNFFLLPHCG